MESLKCFPFFNNKNKLRKNSKITKNYEKILEYLNKNTNQDIIKELNMSQGALSVYKKNLERMGIIDTQTRGIMVMRLPRFSEFIKFNIELE